MPVDAIAAMLQSYAYEYWGTPLIANRSARIRSQARLAFQWMPNKSLGVYQCQALTRHIIKLAHPSRLRRKSAGVL